MRTFIGLLSIVGVVLFGSSFILSYTNPLLVESIARDMIRMEVERRVGEKLATLKDSHLISLAQRLSAKNTAEINAIKLKLADELPQKVAAIVAEMGDINCECRKAIAKNIMSGFEARSTNLTHLNKRLTQLIRTKYMAVSESLTREFRIFTAANTIMFALLGVTAVLRKRANLQLVLPAAVLLGATLIVSYLYVFNQDWLHTILFGDYIGLGYFAYLGLATAGLVDIAFNKARLTTRIVNLALNILGSAVQAAPC